jgi:DNA-cytosine methyltransferase
MNVLSLFDGMSCGRLALERLNIPVDKYYAAEIDKYAIQVSEANYPDIIRLGDVCDVKAKDLPKIDLVMGGSPCQGFSFAGKQLAFDDPRSALFFEFVRILKECNPKYFLLENVRMKKEFLDVISEQVGVEPICINSSLVSAQNRVRYYWTNIPSVEQPEQRGIVLRDVLENGFDSERDKSYCLDANYYKGSSVENYFKKSRRQMVFQDETHDTPKQVGTAVDIKGFDIIKRVYSPEGKSPTLTTMGGGHREPKVVAGAWRGRSLDEEGKNVDWKSTTPKQMLELRKDDKSKDNVVVSKIREKSKTVRSGGRGSYDRHEWDSVDELHWRKLTPLECERLQTVPDNYTNHVSNTQRYKMLGNGWTIEVIAHILENMPTH